MNMNRLSHTILPRFARLVGLLLIAGLCILPPLPTLAADFQDCKRCHEAELDGAEFRPYQHMPFIQQKCAACHAAKAPEPVPQKISQPKPSPKQRNVRQKIAWLGDSSSLDAEHGFLLAGDKLGEILVIELQGPNGRYPRQEITVPLLADLTNVEDSGLPPEISEVEILQVKRGVFLSVTIGWRTDTLADAQVRYGQKELNQKSDPGKRLGRYHEVILYDLKPDKTYNFQVTSTDIFGRSQTSAPLTFSTAKPTVTADRNEPGNEENIGVNSRFRRFGNDYLVELSMTRPVTVFIGSKGAIRPQEVAIKNNQGIGPEELDGSHEGLSDGTLLTIVACRNCHQDQGSTTHPVNVLPKSGMVIPPEYPVLPNGRITCASCHFTHSSDNEYLAIKPGKRELCVGCHKDMM
jgi:predicted CXXCH cytochrome family protein